MKKKTVKIPESVLKQIRQHRAELLRARRVFRYSTITDIEKIIETHFPEFSVLDCDTDDEDFNRLLINKVIKDDDNTNLIIYCNIDDSGGSENFGIYLMENGGYDGDDITADRQRLAIYQPLLDALNISASN